MLLKTNTNKVNELVHRIAKAYGASIETEYVCDGTGEYADSCSMYFVIRYGFAVKKIRISDHTAQHKDVWWQKDIKSITVGANTTYNDIERFIVNRINEVKRGALYAAFDHISKCA